MIWIDVFIAGCHWHRFEFEVPLMATINAIEDLEQRHDERLKQIEWCKKALLNKFPDLELMGKVQLLPVLRSRINEIEVNEES